jgi:hemoglobin
MNRTPNLVRGAVIAAGLLLANAPASANENTFNAFGGKAGIATMTHNFVDLLLADDRIQRTFDNKDIERIEFMLAEQFCELTGGPCKYRGKNMVETHAKLTISEAQFLALTEDLQVAMDRAGIPFREQNKLLAKLAPMKRDIVRKAER